MGAHTVGTFRISKSKSDLGQGLLRIRRVPPDGFAEIRRDDACCFVAAQSGNVAAGMRRAAAQIKALNWCAITARTSERAIEANLVVCERPDQQVSATHVGQRGFGVGWTEDKLIRDDAAAKIRRQLAPQLEQSRAVSLLLARPIRRVPAQGVGQL